MNSKLTGEGGGGDDGDVQKQALQFSAINSEFTSFFILIFSH